MSQDSPSGAGLLRQILSLAAIIGVWQICTPTRAVAAEAGCNRKALHKLEKKANKGLRICNSAQRKFDKELRRFHNLQAGLLSIADPKKQKRQSAKISKAQSRVQKAQDKSQNSCAKAEDDAKRRDALSAICRGEGAPQTPTLPAPTSGPQPNSAGATIDASILGEWQRTLNCDKDLTVVACSEVYTYRFQADGTYTLSMTGTMECINSINIYTLNMGGTFSYDGQTITLLPRTYRHVRGSCGWSIDSKNDFFELAPQPLSSPATVNLTLGRLFMDTMCPVHLRPGTALDLLMFCSGPVTDYFKRP